MDVKIIEKNGVSLAVVDSGDVIITDGRTALDFAVNIFYQYGCRSIVLNKEAICEEFFDLKTGILGEIAQKYVTYDFKLAVFGDFSCYTSKSLRDFIYESNRGGRLLFAADEGEAVDLLQGRRL